MTIALIVGLILALAGAVYFVWRGTRRRTISTGGSTAPSSAVIRLHVLFIPSNIPSQSGPFFVAFDQWRKAAPQYQDVPWDELKQHYAAMRINGETIEAQRPILRHGNDSWGRPVLVMRKARPRSGLNLVGKAGEVVTRDWIFEAPKFEITSSGNAALIVRGVIRDVVPVVAGAVATAFGGPAAGAAVGAGVGAITSNA